LLKKKVSKSLKEPTLFGKTTQLLTEVKYLGLTLHNGFAWVAHMNEVTNEEHSLLNRQRFFEKTWGQTKRCVLAAHHGGKTLDNYDTTVWWRRSKYEIGKVKLPSIACLGMSRAMITDLTTATENLPGLLPLRLRI
jgi:hypothetical protein